MTQQTEGNSLVKEISFLLPPAFRYRSFRSFWLGMVASVSGLQLLRFGQFWLMFQLTSSPLDIGYVALANTIPAFFMTLLGGVFGDILDRRRLVIVTQISIAVQQALALDGPSVIEIPVAEYFPPSAPLPGA